MMTMMIKCIVDSLRMELTRGRLVMYSRNVRGLVDAFQEARKMFKIALFVMTSKHSL